MQGIHKLETLVASWYRDLPHLSPSGQKWLAKNAWWLVLIGVILGVVALASILGLAFLTSALLVTVGGVYGAAAGGVSIFATIVFLALGIISLVLAALAVSPLKARQRKGWTLLFITVLLNVVVLVVEFLTGFDLFGFIWGMLMAAVGAYFLFEIRDQFVVDSRHKKEPVLKKAA